MNESRIARRTFVQATATGLLLGGRAGSAAASREIVMIDEPFHGAVLNRRKFYIPQFIYDRL